MGIEVHVWTVNEIAAMREMLDLGVDGIISDYPARLMKLLSERARANALRLSCHAPQALLSSSRVRSR